jgi:hypothetical protein
MLLGWFYQRTKVVKLCIDLNGTKTKMISKFVYQIGKVECRIFSYMHTQTMMF